jgi:hypothetical protein
LDEILANKDEAYCRGVNLAEAREQGILKAREVERLMKRAQKQLAGAGYRDLLPKPTHYLVSLRHAGSLVLDTDGLPAVRLCNFGLIQKRK